MGNRFEPARLNHRHSEGLPAVEPYGGESLLLATRRAGLNRIYNKRPRIYTSARFVT